MVLVNRTGLLGRFGGDRCEARDFNRFGVCVEMPARHQEGTMLSLSFELGLDGERVAHRVAGVSAVVRSVRWIDDERVLLGLEYLPERLANKQIEALERLEIAIKRI